MLLQSTLIRQLRSIPHRPLPRLLKKSGSNSNRNSTVIRRARPLKARWSYSTILIVAMVILLVFEFRCDISLNGKLRTEFDTYPSASVSSSSSTASTSSLSASASLSAVNVLFALKGNHEGFLAEFEVALKSVLLNAPLDRSLNVHIMADKLAYDALENIFNRTELRTWTTRNPINLYTYDVSSYIPEWKQQIATTINWTSPSDSYSTHTIGCFFRLFAHHVLPSDVEHILYMDTDVVILTNLDGLWQLIDDTVAFQWGKMMCSGFVLLNVPRINEIWTMARRAPLQEISNRTHHLGDQTIFVAVNETFPDAVGILPEGWDLTISEHWRPHHSPYDEKFPNAGMLHLNGQRSRKESYFDFNGIKREHFMTVFPNTWGMAGYYVHYPWTWARYKANTTIRANHIGNPLNISHNGY